MKELHGFMVLDKKNKNRLSLKSMTIFLEFLGGLFSRCLLVNIQAPVKLSYYTLASLRNTTISETDYSFYFIMDCFPKAKVLFNLLSEDPSLLEHIGMEFNDQYPLLDPYQPISINEETILKYISLTGKYVLTTLNGTDVSNIEKIEKPNYKKKREKYFKLLKAFNDGFFINAYGIFLEKDIGIYLLDNLICQGDEIKINELDDFVMNYVKPEYSQDNGTPKRRLEIQREGQIFNWFQQLLLDPTIKLPYDVMIADPSKYPNTDVDKKHFYYKHFIPKLIYFWTSSRSINKEYIHTIHFEFNDPTDETDFDRKYSKLNSFPKSHTCSRTLDLPIYLLDLSKEEFKAKSDIEIVNDYLNNKTSTSWKEVLLRRLCIAVYQTSGFGMAGGKKQVVNKECLMKHVEKHCSIKTNYNESFMCAIQYSIKCITKGNPKQQKRMQEYAKKNAIDFQHTPKSQLLKWVNDLYHKNQ